MTGSISFSQFFLLSLYMQQTLHLSPLATGLIIAPQGVAGFTTGMLAPRLAARLGVRRVLVLAGAAASVGFAVLTRLPAAGYSPLLTAVILVGFGGAGTAFGSIVLATRELADGDQGLAGGVVNTSRQMGAAVGAALLPAVAVSIRGVSGDRAAMLTATVVALAATAVSLSLAGRRPPCTPDHGGLRAPHPPRWGRRKPRAAPTLWLRSKPCGCARQASLRPRCLPRCGLGSGP